MTKLRHETGGGGPGRQPDRAGAPQRRQRRRQRGATLIEAAIVTPVFFLMIFGVIEFGGAYKDKLSVRNASTSGARVASAGADDAYTDYNIIQAVAKALSAAPRGSLEYIVVYYADTPGAAPSSTCAGGAAVNRTGLNQSGACNVYRPADFDQPKANFGCQLSFNLDKSYCPTDRKVAITAKNGGPPDYVGVYVKMEHQYWTRFIGTSATLTDSTVIRIEPRRL